jgi:hypothetical protein
MRRTNSAQTSPSVAPVIVIAAVMPAAPMAATSVTFGPWLRGAVPTTCRPRGARP